MTETAPNPNQTEALSDIETDELQTVVETAAEEIAEVADISDAFDDSHSLNEGFFKKRGVQLKKAYEIAKNIALNIGEMYKIEVGDVTLTPLETMRARLGRPALVMNALKEGKSLDVRMEDSKYVQKAVAKRKNDYLTREEKVKFYTYELLTFAIIIDIGASAIQSVFSPKGPLGKHEAGKKIHDKAELWQRRYEGKHGGNNSHFNENNPVLKKKLPLIGGKLVRDDNGELIREKSGRAAGKQSGPIELEDLKF